MKFGLDKITNDKIEPHAGLAALCPCCGKDLIPKCGNIKIHHWSHKSTRHCDPWWEPESEWHRKWKNMFPKEWQETVKIDPHTNQKHIADVYNPELDLVIEFQNSPMSIEEMQSRERFYKRMIWLVNGTTFNFFTYGLDQWNEDVEKLEKRIHQEAIKAHDKPSYELEERNFTNKLEMKSIERSVAHGQLTFEQGEIRKQKVREQMYKNIEAFYAEGESESALELKKYKAELEKYSMENDNLPYDDKYVQYR
jgi:competence CoiA-like predicted nuclease